ncbi:family 20 glycosylhydrolase [candidate division KSB1 bacterium]|nr:family 20 glycosylhydrolase [candidate division KSB1 bacterium]
MNKNKSIFLLCLVFILIQCRWISKLGDNQQEESWHAVHILRVYSAADVDNLIDVMPQLADIGLNTIILELDFNFKYESHPELILQKDPITREKAALLVKTCRNNGIRLIPMFQCLGHQSWAEETYPLLIQYPEFDLTPGAYPNNENIYCREWDPLNPKVYEIVFDLLDELIDAFEADAFHVGMDEVFLLGDEKSPATRGMDPAKLYAKAVNDLYNHLVKKRGVEMIMWADRFIDNNQYEFGEWESSANGTAPAIDFIPKDIILSPWHYTDRESYPSIPVFLAKGFRVLPASFNDTSAVNSLIKYSYDFKENRNMLGHLFTTWTVHAIDSLIMYSAIRTGMETIMRLENTTDSQSSLDSSPPIQEKL